MWRVCRQAAVASFAAVLLVAALLVTRTDAAVDPTIMWSDCTGPADHPTIGEGNFYNLCIKDHRFINKNYAWTFTHSVLKNTTFTGCTFANTPAKKMNLSFAQWSNVKFTKTTFSSFTSDPISFDNSVFQDVVFDTCTFQSTARVVFSKFEFMNVMFLNCQFGSDALFELGQMTQTFFNNTIFSASPSAKTPTPNTAVTFKSVTVRNAYFTGCNIVNPLFFEAAAVANMQVNKTNIGAMWCHDVPQKNKDPKLFSGFNDTSFDRVQFGGKVTCDRTTWKGMAITNSVFADDGDFSRSSILDLYWVRVDFKAPDKSCRTLDMSKSVITRKLLSNTTVACIATFEDTKFDHVFVQNFNAQRPNFKNALFSDQEYIDGQCCTRACIPLSCKCNVTAPSGQCPVGSSKVNINAASNCFAGEATVALESGQYVRMDQLQHADRVAVGGGDHSDVFFFGHRNPNARTAFVRIESTSKADQPLYISPGHYLYVNGRLATAGTVRIGDKLRGPDNADNVAVLAVSREDRSGLFAPASLHGDLLVDGVVVSSYTDAMHPMSAHRLLEPMRWLHNSPFRSLAQRASSIMHADSFGWLARRLGVPAGPAVVNI
jgi:uncharacterized protein YjbI with pentapeptide repeats